MSDGVDITHGGAISVDPEALRAVADAMGRLAPKFADAAAAIRNAHAFIVATPKLSAQVDTVALWASGQRADVLHDECHTASVNTLLMADVYEVVELRAQLAALAIQDSAQAFTLNARIAQLVASDPRVTEMETWLLAGWKDGRYEGLDQQFDGQPFSGAVNMAGVFTLAAALGSRGFGRLPPGATLSGTAAAVSLTPVKTASPLAPPTSLAEAFRRFPATEGAQLKVEKYTMPDGTNRFVLYAKGTQLHLPWEHDEPMDAKSNYDLYSGQDSSSYQATVEALELAGAQPGDRVDVYAHSQAAMNAAYLSTQSEFDVKVQVTAGSPVHPTLSDDQLLIELRHTDDLVSALAGGGAPGGSGSPDSFVASRVGDPAVHPHDLLIKSHWLGTYIETAEMVDASGDVRLQALEDNWRELLDAVAIESTEYQAQRE